MDRFVIRPATKADAALLFEWRNEPSTRAMFKSKEPVVWEDHSAWLDRRLAMDEPNLFLFELDGKPVGTFRIDAGDLSYTVAPECRKRGIASLMLKEVRSRFGRLRAEIYADNLPSIRAARNADLDVVILENLNR